MRLPRPRLTLTLTPAEAKVYLLRQLPDPPCCQTPQRRLVFLSPAHWPLMHHAFPVIDCTNCEGFVGVGWRANVWDRLIYPLVGFDGRAHLPQPTVWLDPPLQERAA